MNNVFYSVMAAGSLLVGLSALAQENKPTVPEAKPKDATVQPSPGEPKTGSDTLEAKFKATMTQATLSGRWCSIKDGVLGPSKEDKYTIVGVNKLSGDTWVINARIQYNKQDIVAPIPVQVKWAGDTPVLIVDQIQVLGGGTYSARVLIYEHTYAGTWSGGDHGGLLNGIITNSETSRGGK